MEILNNYSTHSVVLRPSGGTLLLIFSSGRSGVLQFGGVLILKNVLFDIHVRKGVLKRYQQKEQKYIKN